MYKTKDKKEAVSGIQFTIVDAVEAKLHCTMGRVGRFSELRKGVVDQLRGLRKGEALAFPFPEEADKKEIQGILSACKTAIDKAGLPWRMRYSVRQKKFFFIHESLFGNKKEANQ